MVLDKELLDYVTQRRSIIYADEWNFYKLLYKLYTHEKVPKSMFWFTAGLGTVFILKSYKHFWDIEKKIENKIINGLESKLND